MLIYLLNSNNLHTGGKTMADILEDVIEYFAQNTEAPLFLLNRVKSSFKSVLNKQLSLFSKEEVSELLNNPVESQYLFAWSADTDDRKARMHLLFKALSNLIPMRRLSFLLKEQPYKHCPPYNQSVLKEIEIDKDGLVSLTNFDLFFTEFKLNGMSFTMVPIVESTNCMYWFVEALNKFKLINKTKVRLDPLIFCPSREFRQSIYKMNWFGKSFDWERIKSSTKTDKGRWDTTGQSFKTRFTDYIWEHRDNEIHLRVEEIPTKEDVLKRGTRYFHAIYDKDVDAFIHIDGATIILEPHEWDIRNATHLEKAGKIGKRVKVFRIDNKISIDVLCALCPPFFVWNNDVALYFNMDVLPL